MLRKDIVFFGAPCTLACDGRCDKAWGINSRPHLYFMSPDDDAVPRALQPNEEPPDPDDYVYVGDLDLGTAPIEPGTWEGGHGKPSGVPLQDASHMNKWCARECERSTIVDRGALIALPDLTHPRPNKRRTL